MNILTQPTISKNIDIINPISRGLVLSLPMNEMTGKNIYDKSPLSHVLTTSGNVSTWLPGYLGYSGYNPRGSTDFATANAKFSLLGKPFTVSAWIYARNVSTKTYMTLGSIGTNNSLIQLITKSDTTFTFGLWNNDLNATLTSYTNRWTNIVCSVDNSLGQYCYQDGTLRASRSTTSSYQGDSFICVGKSYALGQAFNGIICNINVWNRALSPTEIKYLYAQPWGMYSNRNNVYNISSSVIDYGGFFPFF